MAPTWTQYSSLGRKRYTATIDGVKYTLFQTSDGTYNVNRFDNTGGPAETVGKLYTYGLAEAKKIALADEKGRVGIYRRNPNVKWARGDKVLAGSVRGVVEVEESPTGAVPNRVGVRLENHNFHWAKADTLRALPAGEGRGLKVLQNPYGPPWTKPPPRGGGVNARGGWRHVPGSCVWLAKYASGPSYQIVCDDATYVVGADGKGRLVSHSTNYALEEGRWSTKADSFKGSINIGTYRTLSQAQRKAASLRSQWRLGKEK